MKQTDGTTFGVLNTQKFLRQTLGFLLAGCCLALVGCQSTPKERPGNEEFSEKANAEPESMLLHQGDTLRISFPGAENLNTVQQIRLDGRVTLPIVGEFTASGLTPSEMEKQLVELYGPQLQSKEVSVAVQSSAFIIYVTGAVMRPGKVTTDRPINILTAAMEAGGFDNSRANLKAVRVIRTKDGVATNYTVNVQRILNGSDDKPFALKPGDIVYVSERFSWF